MSPTVLAWGAWGALALALAGLLVRGVVWLRRDLGPGDPRPTPGQRMASAAADLGRILVSRRTPRVVATFVKDVALQGRLLHRDPVRWAAHLALFVGFSGLLLVHALARLTTVRLFPAYVSTLGPWLWLRDLLGLMVLGGLAIGIARRRRQRGSLPVPSRRDPLFVVLIAAIVASGFLLAAAKVVSSRAFDRMLAEYPVVEGDAAVPLKAYWADAFGVVFSDLPGPLPDDALAAGKELHLQACADCHARPQLAAGSYALSRALVPAAGPLRAIDAERWLLWGHVLLSLLALALLPFGRAFHALAVPAQLLAGAGARWRAPGGPANRRSLALDACVRCGLCDEQCSVRPLATRLGNRAALPSAKLAGLRLLAGRRPPRREALLVLADGAFACTDCGRCTRGCPAGIDLADLWSAGREALAARDLLPAHGWIERLPAAAWADRLAAHGTPAPARGDALPFATSLTADRHAFSSCVQCQTCTNVCPVVEHAHGDGAGDLDATPQKAMNLLRLGLTDLALGSRIVWDCATCYQCQEHCPAGVRVTDILYELRNRAYHDLGALERSPADPPRAGGAA
jgi:heterodisulfide reductase subunit C/nitrate reductase gamma subunit